MNFTPVVCNKADTEMNEVRFIDLILNYNY